MDSGRIGILTGGGDCPGLNAVIRAVVRRALADDVHVLGFKSGWQGLITGDVEPLPRLSVAGIQFRGGTILGTSRTDPFSSAETLAQIRENWRKYGLRALVVIGGLRLVFKPLVTAYENWVKSTPDTADDERLAKIEASVPYKWLAWLLDYAASIKVGPQSKQ